MTYPVFAENGSDVSLSIPLLGQNRNYLADIRDGIDIARDGLQAKSAIEISTNPNVQGVTSHLANVIHLCNKIIQGYAVTSSGFVPIRLQEIIGCPNPNHPGPPD